jgi:hypothetical protein
VTYRDEQEKSLAIFISRLMFCGMDSKDAVKRGYDFALSMVMASEQRGVQPTHHHMKEASFLLSGAMQEVPRWLAAWELSKEESGE